MKKLLFLSALALLLAPSIVNAQKVTIKSNLLYDATATINLGVEFQVANKMTLDISGNCNPWEFNNGKQWQNYMIQPELRYWTCRVFRGHFFGIHGLYASYDINKVSVPRIVLPKIGETKNNRFDGWGAGVGISYGYQWRMTRRLNLEATIGIGFLHTDYTAYEPQENGRELYSSSKDLFMPTKAGITLVYKILK